MPGKPEGPVWVVLRENRAAREAVGRVADDLAGGGSLRSINPLFLHGVPGTGKSALVSLLLAEVSRRAPTKVACVLPAAQLEELFRAAGEDAGSEQAQDLRAAREADVLVVEDLQHLDARWANAFAVLLDRGLARQQQVVCTSTEGPARLTHLPGRLTSRLGQGLVVGLELLDPGSRIVFLRERARQRGLSVDPEVVSWLADHTPGSPRQLDGALVRLEGLGQMQGRSADLDEVRRHFTDAEARRPTLERIAQRVGRYYAVDPRQLCSRKRSHDALLPRQVGMYLARQLTALSLEQIGTFFGGRDHSTVLHAVRKVEQALAHDASLSGAIRQLSADLA